MTIATKTKRILEKLNGVKLVAATKTRTVEEIKDAISAGVADIGENYVQEAEIKYILLKDKVRFHLIGHLQTNKVKRAVKIFDMIQTIDNVEIAREINNKCIEINKIMPCLIEVNIAKEQNKTGCTPEEILLIVEEVMSLSNLKLEGLMTMAPFFEDKEKIRPYYKKMKQIYNILKDRYNLSILSMGMSDSYDIAIEEGATMVRIGSEIFGKRQNAKTG